MIVGVAPTREVLANGVTFVAKRTSTTPAVTLIANLRAGSVHDTAELPGLAHFVSRTIDRGTERYSADELAEQLDNRGVTLAASVTRHTLSLACTCLVEDLDDVLGLGSCHSTVFPCGRGRSAPWRDRHTHPAG